MDEMQPTVPPSMPQGVPPGYQPYSTGPTFASWGGRIGAYFARALPVSLLFVPVWVLLLSSTATTTSTTADGFARVTVDGPGAGALLIAFAVYALMFLVQVRMMIQRGRLGYDFGDAVAGQRLVRDGSGMPLGSGWSVFGRSLLHIVDALPCYAGFFAPLWTAKKQTFADSIMGTVVVKHVPAHEPKRLLLNAFKVWERVIKN